MTLYYSDSNMKSFYENEVIKFFCAILCIIFQLNKTSNNHNNSHGNVGNTEDRMQSASM